jgi:HPt (histidine-containing phosphotransfer) domain-containing protein
LAVVFLEDSPKALSEIAAGLAQGDARRIEDAAHSLKGLVATFEAQPSVEAARRVEDAAGSGAMELVRPLAQRLDEEIGRLNAALRVQIGAEEG